MRTDRKTSTPRLTSESEAVARRRREREERRSVELLELHAREHVGEEVEDEPRLDAHLLAEQKDVLELRQVAAVDGEDDLVDGELREDRRKVLKGTEKRHAVRGRRLRRCRTGRSRTRPRSFNPHHGCSRMRRAIDAARGVSPTRTTVRKLKPSERTRRATRRTVTRSDTRKRTFTMKKITRNGREMKSHRAPKTTRASSRLPKNDVRVMSATSSLRRSVRWLRYAPSRKRRPDKISDDGPHEDEVPVELVERREPAEEVRQKLAPEGVGHGQRREGDAEVGRVQERGDRSGLLLQHSGTGASRPPES